MVTKDLKHINELQVSVEQKLQDLAATFGVVCNR